MTSIGSGVREIGIAKASGAFRVIYVAPWLTRSVCSMRSRRASGRRAAMSSWRRLDCAESREGDAMEQRGTQVFASAWDALEPSPEQAASFRLRADILSAVKAAIDGWRVTRPEAAHRLGLTRSRLDDLAAVASRAGVAIRVGAAAA